MIAIKLKITNNSFKLKILNQTAKYKNRMIRNLKMTIDIIFNYKDRNFNFSCKFIMYL